jgi:hypothetical protein
MKFGEFFGNETSNVEFKHCSMYFENQIKFEDAIDLLRTGKWIFNSSIINTLTIYLKKYLAKYIVSFTNKMTISETENGSLYIGIDDRGFISGIPFEGNLDINFLELVADSIFKSSLNFSNESLKEDIRRSIKFEIIEVEYDQNLKLEKDQYEIYMETNQKQIKDHEKYLKVTKTWSNIMNSQNGKLSDMMNNERFKIINDVPIRKRDYKHSYSHLYYLCDVPDYYELIADRRIKKYEVIDDSTIKQYKNVTEGISKIVPSYKINDLIVLHKLARYKDYTSSVFKEFKITKPPRRKSYSNSLPQFLLSQSNNMIVKWLNNNTNMRLFVIKITIPMRVLDGKITYFNEKKRKFEDCYRAEDLKKGPITVSI